MILSILYSETEVTYFKPGIEPGLEPGFELGLEPGLNSGFELEMTSGDFDG
jgi:hypothetical protein